MNKSNKCSDKPNVLLIMTDQHRADLMTCAGGSTVPTPNIDRIAQHGVRFTHAYCSSPICVPSRMSLLTGLYAHTTGAITNKDFLDWRYRTITHHFAEAGYLTALIGKMHFNDAHVHGFEYHLSINDWLMYLGPKVQHYADEVASHPLSTHFYHTVFDDGAGFPEIINLWDNGSPWVGHVKRSSFNSMASHLEAEDHLDIFIARESVKFMQRYQDQPFFLVASFMKPHTPLFPPKKWADLYPIDEIELPPVGRIDTYPPHIQRRIKAFNKIDSRLRRAYLAGYFGNLAFVDTCIGYVLDGLRELGLEDNTIIVYTSDHGEMAGDHGLYQKFCMFEPSVRVPLIVSYPKKVPCGKVTNALTEYIGLYPTLAEFADLNPPSAEPLNDMPKPPKKLDVTSFTDVLMNPDAEGPSAVFCEYNLKSTIPQYMIRKRRYKYIFNHGSIDELYDLETYPGEFVNLINEPDLEDVRKELKTQLFAWYDPHKNPYLTQKMN